jgi:hypothetical protein
VRIYNVGSTKINCIVTIIAAASLKESPNARVGVVPMLSLLESASHSSRQRNGTLTAKQKQTSLQKA